MKCIGISQRLLEHSSYFEIREALSLEWGEFFGRYLEDFLPLPLSYRIPVARYMPVLSGVILSGGNDLGCVCNTPLSCMRDAYEDALITQCLQRGIPLFGVCRGAQKIAMYFDSTLKEALGHTQAHRVAGNGATFLVNSYHRYCICRLGGDLTQIHCADDGSVESFVHKHACIYGVMWHPERSGGMQNPTLFWEFVQQVRARKLCEP